MSMVIFERQILAIDQLTASIRRRNGAVLSRAGVVRSLLDALHDSKLDVTNVASTDDLYQMLVARLAP